MIMLRGTAFACALLSLFLPRPVESQTVIGTVTERGTGQPVTGAWVVLETPAGERGAGALTSDAGRFILRAPGPGEYRLVVESIGHAALRSDVIRLAAGERLSRNFQVSLKAIDLHGIVATVDRRCRLRPGSGPATLAIWEEAKKALEVARWTEATGAIRFWLHRRRHQLNPSDLRIVAQENLDTKRGYYTGSPYKSISVDSLSSHGFVQTAPDGELVYYAPDAAVLLSENFLDDHCFSVAAPTTPSEAHLVGLEFKPVPQRDVPDISGTLWLNRFTAELDRIDFTYTRLPFPGKPEWPQIGGTVRFQRLENGMWIVRSWRIRMPVVRSARSGEYRSAARHLELAAISELVGEVTWAATASGDPLMANVASTLTGTVVNEEGDPVEGAEVKIMGTLFRAMTDEAGKYRIELLPSGRYDISVRREREYTELRPETVVSTGSGFSALVASMTAADTANWQVVELRPGEETDITTVLPTHEGAGSSRGGVIQGVVFDAASRSPVQGALVGLTDASGETIAEALTSSDGRFAIVGVDTGAVALRLDALGYRKVEADAPIQYDGRPLHLEVEIEPEPLALSGLRVSVTPQRLHLRESGFYERKRRGRGEFLTPEDIRSVPVSRTSSLMRRVAPVTITSDGEPVFNRALQQRFTQGAPCLPALYVDGASVRGQRGGRFDDLVPPPEDIDALEIYPGGASVPPRWGGSTAACGVIVIWTAR